MVCSPSPVALSIGNVSLPDGGVMRGIDLQLGTPAQHFAFMPQANVNNSYVYDFQSPCERSSAFCTTYRGGLYDQSSSTTSQVEPSIQAAGGSPGESLYGSSWVTDDFTLGSNVTESAFSFGLARTDPLGGNGPQAVMGLGPNSTLLNTLRNTGQIASRTWSMFWGLTGSTSDQQANGTLVLGGYDSSKISGRNYTRAFSPGCNLQVTLTDINMRYPNGSRYSLFAGSHSTALNACIEPNFPLLMTLPIDYYSTFEDLCGCHNVGRSLGVNFYGMLFNPRLPVFDGDLILEIDSSLEITIQNSQLLRPDLTIGDNGALSANYSAAELLVNSLQSINENDLPILGTQFLTGAMIMVNMDTQSFTLWQAETSASQSLVAVDSSGNPIEQICNSVSSDNGTSSPQPQITAQSSVDRGSLSTGAIVGIVVAVVAAIVVAAGAGFLVIRRRRRNKQATLNPTTSATHEPKSEHWHNSAFASYNGDAKPPTPPYEGLYEVDAPAHSGYHEFDAVRPPVEMPTSRL